MSIKTGDVTIDGQALFPATYDPTDRWHGFLAAPAFDRATAERIFEWSKDNNTFEWDGDVLVHTVHTYKDDDGYKPDRIEPDEHGRYTIGAYTWVWSEPDEDDEES